MAAARQTPSGRKRRMARSSISHALFVIFAAGLSAGGSHARANAPAPASQVTVLGLPLGGPLKPSPRVCKTEEITAYHAKAICWLSQPVVGKDGSRAGLVLLPYPESRPEWAAYAEVYAVLSQAGNLEWLSLTLKNQPDKHQIADSISKRFGAPSQAPLAPNFIYATWRQEGLQIDQACDHRLCTVKFRLEPTAEERAKANAAYEETLRRKAQRPLSP